MTKSKLKPKEGKMSLFGIVKTFASIATLVEPHVSRFIDTKKEIEELRFENEVLFKTAESLRQQRLVLFILTVVFFVAFAVTLILLLTR